MEMLDGEGTPIGIRSLVQVHNRSMNRSSSVVVEVDGTRLGVLLVWVLARSVVARHDGVVSMAQSETARQCEVKTEVGVSQHHMLDQPYMMEQDEEEVVVIGERNESALFVVGRSASLLLHCMAEQMVAVVRRMVVRGEQMDLSLGMIEVEVVQAVQGLVLVVLDCIWLQ